MKKTALSVFPLPHLLPEQPRDPNAAVHTGAPEIGRQKDESDLKSTGLSKIIMKRKGASLSEA